MVISHCAKWRTKQNKINLLLSLSLFTLHPGLHFIYIYFIEEFQISTIVDLSQEIVYNDWWIQNLKRALLLIHV